MAALTGARARNTGLGMLAALGLMLGGPAGFAAEKGGAEPAADPGTPIEPAQAEPAQAEPAEAETPPKPKLLGDLGGLRPTLANYGIDLGVSYIGETFGVLHGGV